MITASWSTFEGRVLYGCSDVTVTEATAHAVAAMTLKSTPTRSSHSGTTLEETYVAGQEESGCVEVMFENLFYEPCE